MGFRIQNKNSQLFLRPLAATQGAPVFQDDDRNPQDLVFESESLAGGGIKIRWAPSSMLYLCISWSCMDNGGQLFVLSNPVAPRRCFTFAAEEPDAAGWFFLKVVDSGKYLCVPGSWTDPKVSVTQGTKSDAASFRWRFVTV